MLIIFEARYPKYSLLHTLCLTLNDLVLQVNEIAQNLLQIKTVYYIKQEKERNSDNLSHG